MQDKKLNYYVFVDDNNGHRNDYYNFVSDATKEQIDNLTKELKKEQPAFGRLGSHLNDLAIKLIEKGFLFTQQTNYNNRLSVDRTIVYCISGNY